MPVRSSVCTYSPSNVANSKYSSSSKILTTPSSLSIGNYRPLTTNTTIGTKSSSYGKSSGSSLLSSGIGSSSSSSSSRYSLSTSSYSPSSSSSLNSSSYSSLNSPSSSTYSSLSSTGSSSTGHYRPLNSSAHNSFSNNRFLTSNNSTTNHYSPASSSYSSRYSSASSSTSSNSDLILDNNYSTYNRSSSNYQPSSSSSSSRRFSYTSYNAKKDDDHLSSSLKLPPEVPRGLKNLGNTCYMNATIQSLYSIELIRNFIFRSHDKTLNSELNDLFKSMKNTTGLINNNSADAQEFLRYLINGLHEEVNYASKRPKQQRFRNQTLQQQQQQTSPKTAQEAWLQYREIVDDSPLVDIVVGQMCSTITCLNCNNKSYCWDPFWDLSLPLERNRFSCKLSDVLDDFTASEILDGNEKPICSNCKLPTRSSKKIDLCRLPPVIILHLKKFTNNGYKMSSPEVKIDKTLNFNMSTYTLAACISHHGHSSSSGHYTSHCKYLSTKWFHFNDDRVKDVTDTFDSNKLTEAYVLFYTLQSSSGSAANNNSIDQSKL